MDRPAPDIKHEELGEQKQPSSALREEDAETLNKCVIQKTAQHTF